jgi:hypothetical protein
MLADLEETRDIFYRALANRQLLLSSTMYSLRCDAQRQPLTRALQSHDVSLLLSNTGPWFQVNIVHPHIAKGSYRQLPSWFVRSPRLAFIIPGPLKAISSRNPRLLLLIKLVFQGSFMTWQ